MVPSGNPGNFGIKHKKAKKTKKTEAIVLIRQLYVYAEWGADGWMGVFGSKLQIVLNMITERIKMNQPYKITSPHGHNNIQKALRARRSDS